MLRRRNIGEKEEKEEEEEEKFLDLIETAIVLSFLFFQESDGLIKWRLLKLRSLQETWLVLS